MTPFTTHIAIVGGGIGGLAAAVALQQRGFSATVFERAIELRAVGAGLLLSPNGVAALEFLGLKNAVEQQSHVVREWRILNPRGSVLQRMRPVREGCPAYSIHRADLQKILVDHLAPGTLHLGHELTDFSTVNGKLELRFSSQNAAVASALIGADGLRSSVRQTLFGAEPARYSGYVGWRGVAPFIPNSYRGDFLSESWGQGRRFGIAAMGNGRCYWYASANRIDHNVVTSQQTPGELLRLFGNWHAPVRELIEGTPEEQLLTNAIFDRPPRQNWTRGAVTLLGDAAHPMTPNLGQGACSALEDACVLAKEFANHRDVSAALLHYNLQRAGRTAFTQRASWLMGKLIQLESPFNTGFRDLSLRLTPSRLADFTMRWLFDFKP